MMNVLHHGGSNGDPSPPTMQHDGQISPATTLLPGVLGETTNIQQKVRIDINRPAYDNSAYPIRALLTTLLKELQKANPTTMLLPIDETSTAGALTMESDVPTGKAIEQYIAGFQDAPGKVNKSMKTVRVFVRICGPQSLRVLKSNQGFYNWLKTNNIYLRTHGFSTSYDVASAGFLSMMSPTLHRRDTISNIIQATMKAKAPEIEIHIVPNQINIGKDANKRQTTAVEVHVDRKHLQKTRELMIEIFDTKRAEIPQEIYFVPSPTNGTMAYELYYQHLSLHHDHVANLRSFAITNVGNIKAEITIFDADGVSNPRQMPFDEALLSKPKDGTNQKLFYSIEPTKASETEGRYLLVTHKESIAEAEKFIDIALKLLTDSPNNMAKIMRTNEPVRRANRIPTSNRFQEYATKLKAMIPTTIIMRTPPENAWKRRTPTTMNLTDDDFPPMDIPKKQRINDNPASDTITNTTAEAMDSLITVDLDAIEQRQIDMKDALAKGNRCDAKRSPGTVPEGYGEPRT